MAETSEKIKGIKVNKTLTLIIGVLSVLIPLLIYFLSLSNKALSYEIISNSQLVNQYDNVDGVEVRFNSEKVENISFTILRIVNTGSEPIRASDFESPLIIKFNSKDDLLRVNLKNKIPQNIDVKLINENGLIKIAPLLMNPDDSFELEVVSKINELPTLSARISGVKNILELNNNEFKTAFVNKVSIALSYILLILYTRFIIHAAIDSVGRVINIAIAATLLASSVMLINNRVYVLDNIFLHSLIFLLLVILGCALTVYELKRDGIKITW